MNLSKNSKFILVGVVIVIVFFALWLVPKLPGEAYRTKFTAEDIQKLEQKDRILLEKNASDVENSARVTLAQIIGGLAILSSLYFTFLNARAAQDNAKSAQENLRITEEGKLTDRFSKAVELLGSEKLDIRLGGIYALERIARDSQKDHWTVMEVLTAFVRTKSPRHTESDEPKFIYEDVQAVLTVIGRRKWTDTENQNINLTSVDMSGYNLEKANLQKAKLNDSKLTGSNLKGAILREVSLVDSDLEFAVMQFADLSFTDLTGVKMVGADLLRANLESAQIIKADLNRADLLRANLSSAYLNNTNLEDANFTLTNIDHTYLLASHNLTILQVLSAKNYKTARLPYEIVEALKDREKGK